MGGEPTDPGSNWYRDPGCLLDELRRGDGRSGGWLSIPGYDELKELRRGGQGVIYSARQRSTRRRVAVKVLNEGRSTSASACRRFEREVDLVAHLEHPHIVRVYDSGYTPLGRLYFTMEYVDGQPLLDYLRSRLAETGRAKRPAFHDLLRLFVKVCHAVRFAHQHGVIHRDLKPSNVLIDGSGEPHVLDFGLAKFLSLSEMSEAAELTRTGEFLGTLAYASPEQVSGDRALADARTDVYSIGVMLYQALTGRHPLGTHGPLAETIRAITHRDPDSLNRSASGTRPDSELACQRFAAIDDDLSAVVLKTLAKDPALRYQSVGELALDIERYLAGEPVEAKRDSKWYVLRATLRRHKLGVAAAASLVLFLLGFSAAMSWLYQRAVAAEAIAQENADRSRRDAAKAVMIGGFLQEMLSSVEPGAGDRDVLVREVLDQAAQRIDSTCAGEPEVATALHTTIGNAFRSLGRYDDAEPHLRAALETLAGQPILDPLDYAAAASNLAAIQASRARYPEAESLYGEALVLYRREVQSDHPSLALTLNNLGALLVQQGRYDEAQMLYTEALEINRRRHGDRPHPDLALCLSHLGGLNYVRGQHEAAQKLFNDAAAMYVSLHGENHPLFAYCTHNSALALLAIGRYDEAEPLLRRALVIRREQLGEVHPDVADSLYALARLQYETGLHPEALTTCRQALAIQEQALGEAHPSSLRSRELLTVIEQQLLQPPTR